LVVDYVAKTFGIVGKLVMQCWYWKVNTLRRMTPYGVVGEVVRLRLWVHGCNWLEPCVLIFPREQTRFEIYIENMPYEDNLYTVFNIIIGKG